MAKPKTPNQGYKTHDPQSKPRPADESDLKVWHGVRAWYHFPSLREPLSVGRMDGGACINFQTGETIVGEDILAEMQTAGLPREGALAGIYTHEIGHYMVFPHNLSTIILLGKMTDDFFKDHDQETRHSIIQMYADMANDTRSVLEEPRTDAILDCRLASQSGLDKLNSKIREVMLAYLMHQAERPYKLEPELEPFLKRMLEIDFLDQNHEKMRLGIWSFGGLIIDMLKKYASKKPGGSGCNLVCPGPKDMCLPEILENATPEDIREALREIRGKIHMGEYKKLEDWLKENGAEFPELPKFIAIGTSEGEIKIDPRTVRYYTELSRNYPLPVAKKLIDTESTTRSFSETEKWRPGTDTNLALLGNTGGKLLPGVTRKIRIAERPKRSRDYEVPNLLVVIDSSGSMPNPAQRKSFSVLGGVCGVRAHHLHGAAVGIINFSGSSFYLPYTRNLEAAIAAVCAYQGGGTVADVDMIRKMLGPEIAKLYEEHPERNLSGLPPEAVRKELAISMSAIGRAFSPESVDVLLFTDGGIHNLEEVLDFFEERAELNRATIILSHCYPQALKEYDGRRIRVVKVDDEKDIPNIIAKRTQESFTSLKKALWR